MRLPDTCDLSPLRQVYVVRLLWTDGKRNLRPYMKVLHYDGSPFDVATDRDLGSLPRGQATQNPVATGAAISVSLLYFGAWSA